MSDYLTKVPESKEEAILFVGQLRRDLKNHNYLKYLNVARNEIAKFDKYAWMSGFRYIPDDLKYVEENGTFEDLQEEKRRLRLSHAFRNSNEDEVTSLVAKIPVGMDSDTFAKFIAKGYRLLSEDIHKLSYSVEFDGLYCPTVTKDKKVNECLNVILDDIEFDVGKMVPRPRKRKMVDAPGTS